MANPTNPINSKIVDNKGLFLRCSGIVDDDGNLILQTAQSAHIADVSVTLATITAAKVTTTTEALILTNMTDGSADNTLVDIGATNSGDVSGAIEQNFDKIGDEVNLLITAVNGLITLTDEIHDDHAVIRTDLTALAAKVNAILARLENLGLIADS